MNPFEYYNPVRVLMGEGRIHEIKNLWNATCPFVLLDRFAAEKSGALLQLQKILPKKSVFFDEVEPNPQFSSCVKAAALYRENDCDFVLGVGGGSAMDAAKFVAALVPNFSIKEELFLKGEEQSFLKKAEPIGVIPTLFGSGSELTWACVISRKETQQKRVVRSPHLFPKFAILDPTLALSSPKSQLSLAMADAMVHVLEHYLTPRKNAKVQDAFSEGLINTIFEESPRVLERNKDAMSQVMLSAALALGNWLSMGVPRDFATHAISYHFSGTYNLSHGATLSSLYPSLLWELQEAKAEQLSKLYTCFFKKTPQGLSQKTIAAQTIGALLGWFRFLGLPCSLSELGLKDFALKNAKNYFKNQNEVYGETYFDYNTLERILNTAMKGPPCPVVPYTFSPI